MEKITTRDISTGVKVAHVLVCIAVSAIVAALQIGFSGGQTVQQIETLKIDMQEIKIRLDDTVKVKEQTAVDIAVMKTKMENMDKSLTNIERLLTPKRQRDESGD